MITKEQLLDVLNNNTYTICISKLATFLKGVMKEGKILKQELEKMMDRYEYKADVTNNRDLISFINKQVLKQDRIKEKILSNKTLQELFNETGNRFFDTLIKYRRASDKYTKLSTLIKTLNPVFNKNDKNIVLDFLKVNDEVTIPEYNNVNVKLNFEFNNAGGVSVKNPVLPLSAEEVKEAMFFNVSIQIESIEDMVYFYNKYYDIILKTQKTIDFLVIGKMIYARIIEEDMLPALWIFGEEAEQMKELIGELYREYPKH